MSTPAPGEENTQPQSSSPASTARSALNKLRVPLRLGKAAKLAGTAVKAKLLLWIAAIAAVLVLIGLLLLILVGMSTGISAEGLATQSGCPSTASAETLAPGGGVIVGASEYGGPGDPGTPSDEGAFGLLDGRMAYAELGLSGTEDSNWQDANKIGHALGLGGALAPHTKLQITANGHSVIAEKLDDGAGGGPVGSPSHERVIDLWYQTAAALGVDTTDSGQWSGLVRIQVVNSASTTAIAQQSEPSASQASATSNQPLGDQAAVAFAQSQHASLVGFAVADSTGKIVASYDSNATDYGRSITKSMLLVAYLRQAGNAPLSTQARTNLSAMIEQSANGNEGPGADWVYDHLHNPNAAIEQVAHDAGMSDFHLNTSDPVYVLGRSRVSANDMALLFSKIRQLMPSTQAGYGMTLLSSIAAGDPGHTGIYDAGIASGSIYSKSGWEQETDGGYTFNQAALITFASQQYAIAVITANNPSYAVGESIVQNIATDIFQAAQGGPDAVAVSSGTCAESSPVEEDSELGGRIVQIAQSQLGTHETGDNCSPYGPCQRWCSDFLTWVWKRAGINIARMPGSSEVYTWGQTHSKVLPPTATPAPGDAVEFGSLAASEHVGIVERVFPNGEIIMISGNWNDEVGRSQPFQPSQSAKTSGSGFPIYGYVVP
jgi:CHAP domain